jgi:hypothetical protein
MSEKTIKGEAAGVGEFTVSGPDAQRIADALTAAPGAKEGASEEWPEIPSWMVNPLVFRDANLGIVLVSGRPGDQMIWRKHASAISGFHWCSARKVNERDGFQFVEALNRPAREVAPALTVTSEQIDLTGHAPDCELQGAAAPICTATAMDPNRKVFFACTCGKDAAPPVARSVHPKRRTVITHDQARAALQRFINRHFNNPGEKSRASIPAHQDDDDILLSDYITQREALGHLLLTADELKSCIFTFADGGLNFEVTLQRINNFLRHRSNRDSGVTVSNHDHVQDAAAGER